MAPENSTPSLERADGVAGVASTQGPAPLRRPATRPRSALVGTAVALICVAGALALERLFDPWLGLRFPFFALFLGTAVAARARGPWAGALTALLSYLIAHFVFGGSPPEPFMLAPVETAAYALFSALLIALASVAQRRVHTVDTQMRERQTQLAHEIAERERLEMQHAEAVKREQAAREQAEAAQHQLEERVEELETLMDLIPIGIYVAHDRECRRITGNRAAGALLSTDPRGNLSRSAPPGEQRVRAHRVLQNGRELSLHELPLQRAAREGTESAGEEFELAFDDGGVTHVFGYASPLFDQDGTARGAIAALMDISARKQTEAQLEEAHARISAILESVTDAFYALDRQWRYTYVNRQAELYYGMSKDVLLGRSIWDVFPALRTSQPFKQYHRAVEENVPVHFELHSPTTRRWIEVHAYPSAQGLSVFFRDIEARKKSAHELERLHRELNSRIGELETLLELLPVGVWIGNASCDRLVGNRAAYEILGLPFGVNASMTSPDAIRPPLSALQFSIDGTRIGPEALPMHKVARTGVPCENIEYEVTRADGTMRSVLGSAAPLFDEDGRVRAVIGAHTDITERKHAETALRQADRRKDEFLATLAHELRNPLNPIRSAVAILRLQTASAQGRQWPGEVIDRQVQQMSRLLDDLLDVSRITLNRLELRKQRTPLADIVASALETSRPLIEASGHMLEIEMPPEPIYLDADGTRLAQVFSNLLNNSAKYTDAGGRITLAAHAEAHEAVVAVTDNGIGIAPERLTHVFDMFSQEQPALDRSHSGLGIGLALSRAVVQLHGGSIEAQSDGRGQGSRFSVRLPRLELSSSQSSDAQSERPSQNALPRRILVVDDNRDSAESLALYLDLLGHTVRTAHDGNEALTAAAAFHPDIILLDIGLPGQNGYEVARRIRSNDWGRGLLLIAITGWGQDEDKRRARENGFDVHLTKPVDPQAVAELLSAER